MTATGSTDSGDIKIKIDDATYSGQGSTATNIDVSSFDLTGAVTSTGDTTLHNFTFAGSTSATAEDLATALAGSDEIDSATVNDNGTLNVTFATGQDKNDFELSNSSETAAFTAA